MSNPCEWQVEFAADAEEVVQLAAHELAAGLSSMLGARVEAMAVSAMAGTGLRLKRGRFETAPADCNAEKMINFAVSK